jgi:uncharacterized metal-binding protein YceD (DUF177 family)
MTSPQHRWHVPVRLEDVPEEGLHLDLMADAETRSRLAEFAGLRELPRLEASVDLMRQGAGLRADGRVSATVGQTCVVTLEPMESMLSEPFEVGFVPDLGVAGAPAAEVADSDDIEFLRDGVADIGAVAAEFFLLGIDRYPRKPGAEFNAPPNADTSPGPFAVLAKFKSGGRTP